MRQQLSEKERAPSNSTTSGEEPPEQIARVSQEAAFAAIRFKHEVPEGEMLVSSPRRDGFSLSIFLKDYPAFDLFIDGQNVRGSPTRSGEFQLTDLNADVAIHITHPIDLVHFYIPRAVLNAIAGECGTSYIETLNVAPGGGINDVVVKDIGLSLLPSLEHIEQANRLFMDHVGTALLVHLAHTYSGNPNTPPSAHGELEPWQRRRTEDMIIARLDGNISLDLLASECGLPRYHFVRAFRKTTGRPPHRRLLERRVERARDLLLRSDLPIAEIATLSGFTDERHFTRIFVRAAGAKPDEWRRQQRS